MTRACVVGCVVGLLVGLSGCAVRGAAGKRPAAPRYSGPDRIPEQWRTHAERTDYEETGRYGQVVGFCQRLASASPYAHFDCFGMSAEGRALPLLILSQERAFTHAEAKSTGKLRVLLQNCIHPGECAGRDASLELARDILITGTQKHLLDHVILLIVPIFNPDGHERFGPYSRINQNGPREMGWRVTATNLNLNRDYAKADAPEMRAWLRLWVNWRPDVFFDNHTTNGSDHQYDLFYAMTVGAAVDPHIAGWLTETLLPSILPKLADDGHVTMVYSSPRDRKDLSKGINAVVGFRPRYSTGYAAICNRPSILVEVHALKPYRRRVRATYDIMLHTLEELNRNPAALRMAIRAADAHCTRARGAGAEGRVALTQIRTDDWEPITYRGVAQRVRQSEITGGEVLEYDDRPSDVETKVYNRTRVDKSVVPPAAYLIPRQWTAVISRLDMHGVEFFPLKQTEELEVETYRLENVKFPPRPFEGRFQPSYETIAARDTRDFPAGTVVVPVNQPRAKVAAHLLEPQAPDSLVAWGFFNAIFEQKEYAEGYVLEPIARRMLAADPGLKEEFAQKLRADEKFAQSPGQRLNFFYRRSAYGDEALNAYPVARLTDEQVLARLRAAASR